MAGRYVDATPQGSMLTTGTTDRLWTLGSLYFDPATGYTYKYMKVLVTAANTGAAGRVFYTTLAENVVNDLASLNDAPAGIALGVIAKGSYGWFLIDGISTVLKQTAAFAISAGIEVMGSSVDGRVIKKTAGIAPPHPIIGRATAACLSAATSVSVKVSIPA